MQSTTSSNIRQPDVGNLPQETVLTPRRNAMVALGLVPAILVAFLANQGIFYSAKAAKSEQLYADVSPTSAFYAAAERLTLMGIVTGYPCGQLPHEPCDASSRRYFRWGESVKRKDLARILMMADEARNVEGEDGSVEIPPGTQTYADVPPGHPYYKWIEGTVSREFMRGYPCGRASEPCDDRKRLYFRPDAIVSRAELAFSIYQADPKIRSNRKVPRAVSFQDVPRSNQFWLYVERVAEQGIMTGHPCNACSASEPCVSPDNRAYFRPNAPATNGQVARAITNSLLER